MAATERGTDPASALSDQKPRGTRRLLRPIFLYESAADRAAHELARRERAMVAAAADGLCSAALQGGSSAARTVVSLCMIVRNNAATIEACLASIRPFVDEMVVVDTGSLDETPEICRRMGARVFHMTWPESFAAARNESLRHARGEWIFWMDSDDLIDAENGAKLKALAAGPHEPDVLGYSMQVRCPGRDSVGAADFCLVDHCKLFRNRPDVRFEFRVHEQLLASINRAGARNVFQDLFVVHAMSDESPRTHRFKYRRDLRYLRRELRELPDHPFVLYNLGMTYHFGPKHAKAVRVLERCVARATSEAIYRRAFFLLAGSLIALDMYDQALDACRRGRKLFPHDPELLFREGVVHQHKQDFAAAEQCMLQALQSQEPRYCLSRDMGIMGHKTRHNLALVHEKAGQIDKAIEQWRIILQELPDYQDGWQGLCDCLAIQGRWDEVAEQAARIVAEQPAPKSAGANGSHHGVEAPGPWAAERSLRALGIWQAARALAARGQVQSARQAYRQGLSEHPHDERLWDAWAQFLYEHGPREESLFVSELIARNRPRSSVDQFNLGLTCLNAGQPERAVECCSRALALQPNVAPHEFTLGLAYLHCNRMTEAVAAWQRALAIDPNHGPSRNALDVARREVNECRVPAAGRAPAVELART